MSLLDTARAPVTRTAALLIVGVLALQVAFVASYVGAFHDPEPRLIPVAVVGDRDAALQVRDALNALEGRPLDARFSADRGAAIDLLEDRDTAAALVLGDEREHELLVAGAEGQSETEAVIDVVRDSLAVTNQTITVTDQIPSSPNDARGLTSFYLTMGWVIGGFLAAAVIGIVAGSRGAGGAAVSVRLLGMAIYSVLSAALTVWVTLGWFDALPRDGALLQVLVGTLVVFAVGSATLALEAWFGVLGIAAGALVFVVLGNPSSGGAFPPRLLPHFWATIGEILPPGASTSAVRGIAYFGGVGLGAALTTLAAWIMVSHVAAYAASHLGRDES